MTNPARSISRRTTSIRKSVSTRSDALRSTRPLSKRHSVIRTFVSISITSAPSVDLDSALAHLETANGAVTAPGDAVIGVDGAFSAVRKSMQSTIANFQYDENYLAHGYKELTIPPGPDGSWRMEKNALHIWPRKSFMMIALPNPDGSFTCTLFWEFEGRRSFATTKTDDDVRRFFDEEFPDAVPLMPGLLDDFRNNPTGSLVTIRCAPWFYRDKVCLVGDAAHAVVPFYGQGMNAAFEDCVVLDECLEKFPENRERAFAEYFRHRKENADALADLAIGNFIEMRDKTASKTFRAPASRRLRSQCCGLDRSDSRHRFRGFCRRPRNGACRSCAGAHREKTWSRLKAKVMQRMRCAESIRSAYQ